MPEPEPPVRPTKRALDSIDDDPLPTIDVRLNELEHPLIVRAQAIPTQVAANGAERIRALTDRIWFKVKTGTWRGAADDVRTHVDDRSRDLMNAGDAWWWLVAAGARQDDSPQRDFYSQLDSQAHMSGPNRCSTDFLLPEDWDLRRLEAELAYALTQIVPPLVRNAAAQSLRYGEIYGLTAGPAEVRIRVRVLPDGEAYVAIGSTGVTDPKLFALLLSAFPGLTVDDWLPEPGPNLNIKPMAGEIVWSTMLPTNLQTALLDELDASEP